MKDYLKHIIAGAIVAALVGLPAYLDSGNLFAGIWAAGVSGLIAGAIKEWCDNTYNWEWSWKDLGFTAIGALLVVLFIIGLHFCKG